MFLFAHKVLYICTVCIQYVIVCFLSAHCVNDGACASLCAVPALQVAAQNHLAAIQPEFHTNLIDAVAELQTDLNTFAQEYTEVRYTLECVQAFECGAVHNWHQ